MNDKIVSITSAKPRSQQPPPEAPQKFKSGDIVQLRSGGLGMTVRKASRHSVSVDWHDNEGNLASADFLPAMLLLCPSDDDEPELQVEVEPGTV